MTIGIKNSATTLLGLLVLVGTLTYLIEANKKMTPAPVDGRPVNGTISGTFTCLLHTSTAPVQTKECAFGIKTDDGHYYAINFGAGQDAMTQFQSGAHMRVSGFFVPKEALSTDQWNKYQMEGIFTVTGVEESSFDKKSTPK